MAGALGFEPRSSVLETDSLTVELTPPVRPGGEWNAGLATPYSLFPIPYSLFFALLGLFMVRMLAAGIAELRELEPPSGGLLVLRG